MKLIVGLGNPGDKYTFTRHNLGMMVVEHFFQDFEPIRETVWDDSSKFKSDVAVIEWQPKTGTMEKVILVKPKTFMNNSGMAVKLIADFYKIPAEDIWVVHDEIDLQLGSLRIRMGGSSAGHRGIESIIQILGTEKFWRFRLGIGQPHHAEKGKHKLELRDVDEFVLGIFAHDEKGKVKEQTKHATKAIACGLEKSLDVAMNKFNTK